MKDLHKAKASHLTIPIKKGIELHLDANDSKPVKKNKIGDKITAHIPMVITSKDEGHTRFKQVSKLKVKSLPLDKMIRKVNKKNNIGGR